MRLPISVSEAAQKLCPFITPILLMTKHCVGPRCMAWAADPESTLTSVNSMFPGATVPQNERLPGYGKWEFVPASDDLPAHWVRTDTTEEHGHCGLVGK